jgi:hypothetical protein
MNAIRELVDTGTRLLTRRVDQLRAKLNMLGSQIRETVADAVGQALGSAIRDTLQHVLDHLAEYMPQPVPDGIQPWRSPRDWESRNEPDYYRENDLWFEEEDYRTTAPEREAESPKWSKSARVIVALSAGLQAAVWCLRKWRTYQSLARTLLIGVTTASIAYVLPRLVTLAIGLLGSASTFGDGFTSAG